MREERGIRRRISLFVAPLIVAALFPAAVSAETRTFVNAFNLFPTGGALTSGPANKYPSSIAVSGCGNRDEGDGDPDRLQLGQPG